VELFDAHAHSKHSYCANEDLELSVYQEALDSPYNMLARQAITNHGFQAYFPSDIAWSWIFLDQYELFDKYKSRGDDALFSCKEEIEACDDRFVFGVEVELMGDGRLTISPEVRKETGLLLGSLHVLPKAYEGDGSRDDIYAGFIKYTRELAAAGVDVIAHPFRWVSSNMGSVPSEIIDEVISIAGEFDVAVELNIRGQSIPRPLLIQKVVRAGLTLSLATDAHRPSEVGDFETHLEFISLADLNPADIDFFWK